MPPPALELMRAASNGDATSPATALVADVDCEEKRAMNGHANGVAPHEPVVVLTVDDRVVYRGAPSACA